MHGWLPARARSGQGQTALRAPLPRHSCSVKSGSDTSIASCVASMLGSDCSESSIMSSSACRLLPGPAAAAAGGLAPGGRAPGLRTTGARGPAAGSSPPPAATGPAPHWPPQPSGTRGSSPSTREEGVEGGKCSAGVLVRVFSMPSTCCSSWLRRPRCGPATVTHPGSVLAPKSAATPGNGPTSRGSWSALAAAGGRAAAGDTTGGGRFRMDGRALSSSALALPMLRPTLLTLPRCASPSRRWRSIACCCCSCSRSA
mmetsp:Transcript_21555/g.54854  ORF Transcript_21555/g.54854 Transcript_21555/m.54854 type:complete len:257 (+) Transcript_21555:3141-3911(+)